MKYLLLALLLLPLTTFATDLQISCTATQKYTDGSAVAAGTVMNFNFYGALQGQPKVLLNTSTAPTTCAFTWKSAPVGTVCIEVTESVVGAESDHSVESCKAIAAPKPAAPGVPSLTIVTTGPTAYVIEKSKDRLVALPAGTIPLGTACDVSQPVLGFYVVPSDSVKWSGSVRSLAVVATCG
jgi:hypothetical protein